MRTKFKFECKNELKGEDEVRRGEVRVRVRAREGKDKGKT